MDGWDGAGCLRLKRGYPKHASWLGMYWDPHETVIDYMALLLLRLLQAAVVQTAAAQVRHQIH